MSEAAGGVVLFVGTRRGLFRFRADLDRRAWRREGFHIGGHEIFHATLEPESGQAWAAAVHPVWGTHVYRSDDHGASWSACGGRPAFPAGDAREVEAIWHVAAGVAPDGEPRLYAGVEPAALFHSDDGGTTWTWHEALDRHPTRRAWQPARGGLALHSIQLDPAEPGRLFVALSAGGCYRTEDGGGSWTAINRGVRADFLPEPAPEAGQCVHSLRLHPRDRSRLYQQNHCGTYRSDDGGDSWIEISAGLPSDFGYVIGLDPADPDRCWVIPEESSHLRSVCDRLSPASVHTLDLQDGPMSEAEAAAFHQMPHADDAVRVRRWDDAGKVPDQSAPPLEHYIPLLRRIVEREATDKQR